MFIRFALELKQNIMYTTQEKSMIETLKHSFELINGEFSHAEAMEILVDLFSKKINFHELKSFSHLIRVGEEDSKSSARIKELMDAKQQIREMLEDAGQDGRSVRLKSTISIELI